METNMKMSRIVYGCAGRAMLEGEDVCDLLDKVLEMGVNCFDTAENYRHSEESLGRWIAERNVRSRIFIITKGCHPYDRDRVTPEDLREDIEKSFRRLHTDYIDIYMLHRDDSKVPVGPLVEVLNEYHKAGKIGRFGGSNWTVKRILEANRYADEHGLQPFTLSSPHFGIGVQAEDPYGGSDGCVNISGPGMEKEREFYEISQMPVFAYSSLGRGFFTGRVRSDAPEKAAKVLDEFAVKGYCHPENFERLRRAEQMAVEKNATVSQIALAWLLNQKMNVFPLVSSGSFDRFKENCGSLNISMTQDEIDWLDLKLRERKTVQ